MKTLFVGGLSWGTDATGLTSAFESYGKIKSVRIASDKETGRSRGFGFVEFINDSEADEAMQNMNGTEIDGRTVAVNIAEKREKPKAPDTGWRDLKSLRNSFPEPEIVKKRAPRSEVRSDEGSGGQGSPKRQKTKSIEQMFIERGTDESTDGE